MVTGNLLNHAAIIKLTLVLLLVVLGLCLEITGLLDTRQILDFARQYTQNWWLILILIVAQAILFTFALAGSIFLWIVAPLFHPGMTTLILTAGGILGALGAYYFSGYLSQDWVQEIQASRSYRLLQAQNNFLTLFAMRVFPGFPHSLVNYSSGILGARLSHFIAAAVLGIAIKSYVYARVIYSASHAPSFDMLLDVSVFGPLILLSVISALGVFINYKRTRK